MAIDTQREQMEALIRSLQRGGAAAHAAGGEVEHLSEHLFSYGKALATVGGAAILKSMFERVVAVHREHKTQLESLRQQTKDRLEEINQAQQLLSGLSDTAHADQSRENAALKAGLATLNQERDYYEKINAILEKAPLKKMAVVSSAILATWVLSLKAAQQYNTALMQASTNLEKRFALVTKLAKVQAQTGLSTEATAEAARELLEYGQDMVPEFQENLKIVGMMQAGLGVSAHTGAELVTIFGKQLRASAESVGNAVARIAAQTGLAATKAAMFGIEIGRALRLLGPSFKTQASGVLEVMGELEGRINDIGGDPASVVAMYRSMVSGSRQGYALNALARVMSPGALASKEGAGRAMAELGKNLDTMLSSVQQGSYEYAAVLHSLDAVYGVSAYDATNFIAVMKQLHEPLDAATTLTRSYQKQMQVLGASWDQIKSSLSAAVTEALLPFVKVVGQGVAALAGLVKQLSANEGFVAILSVTLPLAAIWATTQIAALTASLALLAATAPAAALALATGGAGGAVAGAGGLAALAAGGSTLAVVASGAALFAFAAATPFIVAYLAKIAGASSATADYNKRIAAAMPEWTKAGGGIKAGVTSGTNEELAIKWATEAARTYAREQNENSKTDLVNALEGLTRATFAEGGHHVTPEQLSDYVKQKALIGLEHEVNARAISHGSIKSDADKKEDVSNAKAVEKLNQLQLTELVKTAQTNAIIAREAQKKLDWALGAGTTNQTYYRHSWDSRPQYSQ